jgi:hypothetical protein
MVDTPPVTQAEIDDYYKDLYGGKGGHISKADVAKVQKQILSQGLTSKWKGQGFGSAEANALDMAKSLVASGVTNIKDIAQGKYYTATPVTERLVNAGGQPVQKNGDKYYVEVPDYNTESFSLKEVDPKEVIKQVGVTTTESNGDYGSNDVFTPLTADQQKKLKTDASGQMTVPIEAGEGIINKATGERLLSNYNERTQGNAFGGTYSGEGNTAYRVQFDKNGNPSFYTTQHSSNDLANILGSNPLLNTVANVAASYFGGPLGTMLLQGLEGKPIGDVLKSGALSYIGGEAGDFVKGSEGLVEGLGQTGANILGNLAKSEITSGGKADPLQALISGGLNAGANAIFEQIPGFEGLDGGTQGLVRTAVTSALKSGNKNPASLVSTALQAGMSQLPNATNTPDQATAATENSKFMESLAPYLGGSSAAPKTAAAAPAAQPMVGIDPMALLQAQMAGDNGGAQIKSNYNLFGKDLFGPDKASASSTQDRNAPQSDALMAALGDGGYGEQEFSGGGDVHALLQLLRS